MEIKSAIICAVWLSLHSVMSDESAVTTDGTCTINEVNHPAELYFDDKCPPNTTISMIFKNSRLFEVPNIFQRYKLIRSMDMTNTSLQTIDRSSFKFAANLTILYMADNNITTLHNRIFMGLSKLYILVMATSNISFIESDAFFGLTNLVKLDLSDNNIATLKNGLFEPLVKLENIRLNDNQIQAIDGNAFIKNTALKFIYLKNNQIVTFDPKALINSKVFSIDLTNNPISDVDFSNMEKIKNLIFLNTNLNVLRIPPSVTDINAPWNNISSIQIKTGVDYDLRRLNLSANHLTDLSQLSPFKKLEVLDISYNGIKNIDFKQLQSLTQLKQLSIFGNTIALEVNATEIRKYLPSLNYIEMSTLNLSNSYIENLRDGLQEKNIYLILGNNQLPPSPQIINVPRKKYPPFIPPSTTSDQYFPYNQQLLDAAKDLKKNITSVARNFEEITREIEYISQAVNTSYLPFARLTNLTQQLIDINHRMLALLSDASRVSGSFELSTNINLVRNLVIVCLIVGLLQILLKYGGFFVIILRKCNRRQRPNSGETLNPIFEREEL